ncbi:MAG: segregation/condensation protein A [Candidatus Micrarchaeales archaeon]
MATTTTDTIEVTTFNQREFEIEDFVKNATWRELLVELVDTNKLDPWNIDIIKVVDGYVGIVKKMKVLDLHVPANIILAASILLRMKSETLKVFEIYEPEPVVEEIVAGQRILPDIPPLVPRLRLQPSKKITLMELMSALDEAMKIKEKREVLVQNANITVPFFINKEDIDEKIENIYQMLEGNADKTGLTTFAYMANKFTHEESILLDLFIPLLFLAHNARITIMQEKFFDEIFIKLNTGKRDGKREN